MRVLRIANITDTVNGGMGRVMNLTADCMRDAGHTVDFIWHEDIKPTRFDRSDRFAFPIKLVGEVKRRLRSGKDWDVVEIHEPIGMFYIRARHGDASLPPCVAISHGLEATQWQYRMELDRILHQKTSLKSRILVPTTLVTQAMYTMRHCDQALCSNDADQDYLIKRCGMSADHVSRYHSGVAEKFFVERKTAPTDQTPSLLFVGSWLERKGRKFIVQTYTELKRKYPALKLSIVGAGFPVEEVQEAFSPNIRNDVHVLPRANDQELLEAYATHDIFLFPTYFEAWGLVNLEAAAAGLAIVTTNALGPAEMFTDGVNALLVAPDDSAGLTAAVERLLTDSGLRKRLSEGAVRRAREFSWKRTTNEMLAAYEKAIALGQAARAAH